MSHPINRRRMLALGAFAAGTLVSGRQADAWAPGPNEKLVRDLKPGKTPIRLGAFLESVTPDAVRKLKEAGNAATAIGPDSVFGMSDSELRAFNAALRQHDVVVFEVTGYTNMLDPDPAKRRKNLADLARCIEAADKVGCPMVGTISGSMDPMMINVHPENWSEKAWKILVDGVRQVLKDTAGCKAALGMEAQVTTNQDTPESHRKLMNDVGDPRCAVNFDPVNMIHLYNYYHTTELLNKSFDMLGEQILGCHAKDTFIIPDQQTVHVQEVCAGRGVMDYETYLVRLSRMKWPRTILPEHVPPDQLLEAKKYIEKVAAKVGVRIYGQV